MDCGPACLAMVASHYGNKIGIVYLVYLLEIFKFLT
ncbi:hypothetical protein HMPREF9699_01898 [Bergeyella zoohelcum ATCC 43767]|uniref:Peptidase C39 domain-containing protein n=1 Tax=Bergeyella zoohelcum ATCC 43767 TaxID=883096 RepID=K1LZ23_9FLAO|nr:hypothetical protein HMPREF9699_01898 [Bergeyella zoohelcum ATCC 43767]